MESRAGVMRAVFYLRGGDGIIRLRSSMTVPIRRWGCFGCVARLLAGPTVLLLGGVDINRGIGGGPARTGVPWRRRGRGCQYGDFLSRGCQGPLRIASIVSRPLWRRRVGQLS